MFKYKLYIIAPIFLVLLIKQVSAKEYMQYNSSIVRVLNKITGKVKTINADVGQIYNADNYISFKVTACYKAAQQYSPEDVMFIQVARAFVASSKTLTNNNKILVNANNNIDDLGNNNQILSNFAVNVPNDNTSDTNDATATSNQDQDSGGGTADNTSLATPDVHYNKQEAEKSRLIFSGWMFSTAPEISALVDPTYDITIVRCIEDNNGTPTEVTTSQASTPKN
ncbi:DUF2155 domain-containing protein [Rickettsiales bacterium LUAb2]